MKKINNILKKCGFKLAGLDVWKTKGINIDTVSEDIFILSSALANYLGIRHDNLKRNIYNLQKAKHLPSHLLICEEMSLKGKKVHAFHKTYALNRYQVLCLLMDISSSKAKNKKMKLLKELQNLEKKILENIDAQDVEDSPKEDVSKLPLITDVLEPYMRTPEGIQLWKKKGTSITLENVLDNIFMLSSDLAAYFKVRHNNLIYHNIAKLQKDRYLPDHLLKIKHMVRIGSSAKRTQLVYALTRHQTYRLIMDFTGPKAREKKYRILTRLEAIEADVVKGAYEEARAKALEWDGAVLLKNFGFTSSLEDIATRKDIANFLKIPSSTLNSFLRKYSHLIKPILLTKQQKEKIGSKAKRLYGYSLEDVLRMAFWIDSPIGVELKKKLFGKVGLYARPELRHETGWKYILLKVFAGFDLKFNYRIGHYRVDFYVPELMLILECDDMDHKYYNREKERKREEYISRDHALVRFNSKVSLESLFNGILKAKPGKIVRVYLEDNTRLGN